MLVAELSFSLRTNPRAHFGGRLLDVSGKRKKTDPLGLPKAEHKRWSSFLSLFFLTPTYLLTTLEPRAGVSVLVPSKEGPMYPKSAPGYRQPPWWVEAF